MGDWPLVNREHKSQTNKQSKNKYLYHFIKRGTDIVISTLALVCMLPIFMIMWLVYQFGDNKGPMLYKQERIGKDGKPFHILKFRSMVVDADEQLHSDPALYQKYVDNNFKLPEDQDPRVTRFGKFIRKTSIDELPQFINIFKGEMSIVGPRPVVREELSNYGDRQAEFYSVTPGAMGYWQAKGRSSIEYPERCDVELYYVEHASAMLDLKIVFKNLVSIFKREGAF